MRNRIVSAALIFAAVSSAAPITISVPKTAYTLPDGETVTVNALSAMIAPAPGFNQFLALSYTVQSAASGQKSINLSGRFLELNIDGIGVSAPLEIQ